MARLPPKVAAAILTYVDQRLCANPQRLSGPLHGELEHLRSAHHGDYRVLISIDDANRIVHVHRVAHRAHIYRAP